MGFGRLILQGLVAGQPLEMCLVGGRLGHGQPEAVLASADEVKQGVWQMYLARLAWEKHGLPCSCQTSTL